MSTQKTANTSLFLILAVLIFFSILNFKHTTPIVSVLGFHGIIDNKIKSPHYAFGEMDYSQQELEKIFEYLIRNNYWFLTSQDMYDFFLKKSKVIPAEHSNQKPILISFDDGYKTVHTHLLPILYKLEKKYNTKIKVVLFINPGNLAKPGDTRATHLGCQELREGLQKGFYDIQSHGLNHKDLTRLNSRELVNELSQAQIKLRECTKDLDPKQRVASHFAYPYGSHNKKVQKYTSKYYLSSYLYNHQTLNYVCTTNYYAIPRLAVNRKILFKDLVEMSQGIYQMDNQKRCYI